MICGFLPTPAAITISGMQENSEKFGNQLNKPKMFEGQSIF